LVAKDQTEALDALEKVRPDIEKLLNSQLDIPPAELFRFSLMDTFEVRRVELLSIDKVRTSYSLLLGSKQGLIKIAADIQVEIRLLVTRHVAPEDAPLRAGQGWHPSLRALARLGNAKMETVEESVRKTALLEAVDEKTDSGYANLGQLSVALRKSNSFYGE
jgi:hypothetical protein